MKASSLKDIMRSAKLSRADVARITGSTEQGVDAFLTGEKEPTWGQSLRLMGYLVTQPGAYRLPAETEFDLESIEELERDLTQAASISDMLYSTTVEGEPSHGVLWAVSDKLRACLTKVKQIGN